MPGYGENFVLAPKHNRDMSLLRQVHGAQKLASFDPFPFTAWQFDSRFRNVSSLRATGQDGNKSSGRSAYEDDALEVAVRIYRRSTPPCRVDLDGERGVYPLRLSVLAFVERNDRHHAKCGDGSGERAK